MRQMALGEDDRGQLRQGAPVVEGEGLAAVGVVVEPYRARRVHLDAHAGRRPAHHLGEHPLQVAAVVRAGRVVVRAQLAARPGVQARPGADRTRAVHAVVGEEGHLRGHGVHQQMRRLRGAPDAAGAGRRRVDHVDRQPCSGREQLRRGGAQAFKDAGAPRSRADDGEGHIDGRGGPGGRGAHCRQRCDSRAWRTHDGEPPAGSSTGRSPGSGRSASSCRRREPEPSPGRGIAARCGMRHGYLTRPSRTLARLSRLLHKRVVNDRRRSRSDLGLHDRTQPGGAPALPRPRLFQPQPGRTSVQGQGHELVAEPRAARLAPVDGRPVALAVPGEPAPDRPADRAPPEAEAEPYGQGDGVVDGGAGQLEDAGVGGAGESGDPGVREGHWGSAM